MKNTLLLSIFVLLSWSANVHADKPKLSHEVLQDPVLQLSIWQPAGESEPEPALVVISPGLGGSAGSMRVSAEAIAARGITVISLQHSSDRLIGGERHKFAMENRADEILRASDWAIAELGVDESRIGVLGYSQGGLSVVIAAGATPDRYRAQTHCRENRSEDRGYCGFPPLLQRFLEKVGLADLDDDPNDPDNNFTQGRPWRDFAALAVVAPVAAIVPKQEFRKIGSAVGIFVFGADRALAPAYHADHLHDALGDRAHTYKRYPNSGHGGLMGSDRQTVNADIADFFADNL